jgi:dynein heavy chain 2, cytosolic
VSADRVADRREANFAVVDMSEVNNKWEGFMTNLQQFDAHLEEQKTQLQGQIGKKVDAFKSEIIGFRYCN